jgi:Zn-dependent protease with chaperone function
MTTTTDAAGFQAPPGRVPLPGLSSRAYEHPADRSALVALRSLTGFDVVLKALSGFFRERSHRLMYLASSVRVSDRQFRDIDAMFSELVRILDLPERPELYVERKADASAMAIGMDKPFIVVTTGMLDLMEPDELRFVLAHELGHVLSGHAVYRTMLHHLVRLSSRAAWMPVGYLGLRAVIGALEEWQRKSELSADRAGLLGCQDQAAALRALMKTAGGARLYEMDEAAFLAQAAEYDAAGDLRDGVLKLLNLEGQSHPFTVLRAAELQRWIDDGDYAAIVDGIYPLREDDQHVSFTDEVKATAKSYKRSIDESADPLLKLVKSVGDEAVGIGKGIFNRVAGTRTAPGPGPGGSQTSRPAGDTTPPPSSAPTDGEVVEGEIVDDDPEQ